jgi:mutual gliding-motility protein MglA
MSFINHQAKRIHCKIVYYGPSLGGKTTNMQWVYDNVAGNEKSDLFTLPTDVERTLFFDFLPLNVGQIRGFETRLHLFTVPGQVVYDSLRRPLVRGIDGVVFVADSQAERMEENVESLSNLEKNLEMQGYNLSEIPMVIQYNKRDLPSALPVADLRTALNRFNAPDFEGMAHQGKGVMESFKTVAKAIITVLKGGEI